ncbi:hypothetical protein M758_10G091800 [Ceratodon purpureus]|uniref:Secreted protein n=1 Tax=Ceratodon purpureus TaxID=3225 RepID=A0A8T0GJU5_CERPU|nr:hypothetical protein KC19_10G093300 [Ceratodon purpureus]KAG0603409.1 hypothetical protein M758_10G091800 [Ceratodon purpureus]
MRTFCWRSVVWTLFCSALPQLDVIHHTILPQCRKHWPPRISHSTACSVSADVPMAEDMAGEMWCQTLEQLFVLNTGNHAKDEVLLSFTAVHLDCRVSVHRFGVDRAHCRGQCGL